MSDIWGFNEAGAYAWTGGAGIMGRLMYHSVLVQKGKRKPWGVALLFDIPIALAMGWIVYGAGVYFKVGPEPTVSLSIAFSYLGPYALDRLFGWMGQKYFKGASNEPATIGSD